LKHPSSNTTYRPPKVVKAKITVVKRSQNVKHSRPTKKQRSKKASTVEKVSVQMNVSKVPASEFPAEINDEANLDPSLEDDYRTIFTPEGNHIQQTQSIKPEEMNKEPISSIEAVGSSISTVEDGNVSHCDLCQKLGDLICCDKCPRAFHASCLDQKEFPDPWECPRCLHDCTVQEGDRSKLTDDNKDFEKYYVLYNTHEETEIDYSQKIMVLSNIQFVIGRLLKYDFGDIFSEPVDVKSVPDYRKIVTKPMDLGTIKMRIAKGAYNERVALLHKGRISNECSTLEMIILEILKDIELVWHNCFLYNREGKESCSFSKLTKTILNIECSKKIKTGSSYYRMAKVLSKKYILLRQLNIDEGLSGLNSKILQYLGAFVVACRQFRQEEKLKQTPVKKSWIPFSKNHIQVVYPARKGVRKPVAVFDPSTNMIVKQYSSKSSACLAAVKIKTLGFKCETSRLSDSYIKNMIHKSAMDPSLLLFGYRWILVEKLRNGNFLINDSEEKNVTIKKVCTVSNVTLAEFDSIDSAYLDWKAQKEGNVLSESDDESKETFIKKTLEENKTENGICWKLISNNEKGKNNDDSTTAVKKEQVEDETAKKDIANTNNNEPDLTDLRVEGNDVKTEPLSD
jgi:hypothetical protein